MYFNLKKLQGKAQSLMKDMEGLSSRIEEAEGKNDAKAVETLQAEYNGKSAEFDKLDGQIKEAQKVEARRARLVEIDRVSGVAGKTEGAESEGKTAPEIPVIEAEAEDHGKAERELENQFTDWFFGKTISDRAMDALQPKSKGWSEAAGGLVMPKRLAGVVLPGHGHLGVMGKALPALSNSETGNKLVPTEFKPQLLQYQGEGAPILPRCFVIPTKSGTVIWPALKQGKPGAEGSANEFAEYGFVYCGWTAEGAEKPDSEAQFEQRTYNTYELAAKTRISRTLLNRSVIDIEMLLGSLFRQAAMHKIDLALINGDGNGKPLGILQAGSGIASVNRATEDEVAYEDLVRLQHGVPPQLRANGSWVVADDALMSLKLETDSTGRPLMPINPQTGTYDGLLGKPYNATQRMALGDEGDVIFGDWSQYIVAMEQELVISRSEHRYAELGQILYVLFLQIGGKVSTARAFAKLK